MSVTAATPSARPRCADIAEAAGDPLEGTAPPAEQWFLVEHPGPWERYVLADPRVDRGAAAALDRPGRETVRTGLFTHERELADLVADAGAGEPDDGPLFVVCTHGRHDTCCAVRGRPLAAALAADHPDRTWEASHLGGCRFAAAMVLLPHGIVLGDVPAGDGPEVALRYAKGLLPTRWVRGRAALPPAVQAAQHHARLATGAYGVDALVPTDVRADGPGSWRVAFGDPDATVVLRERRVDTGRPLTCAATAPGWMRVFDLVDVELGAAVPR